MAEDVAAEIARVLRPGGQLLACVDSLVLGMSILAEQHHWAELTDLPQAEVVLIPWPDGRITRCFGPEQLSRPADRGGAGGQLDPAAHRAVPVHGGSRAAQGPERHHAAGPGRAGGGRGGAGPTGPGNGRHGGNESFGIYLLAAARKPGRPRVRCPGHVAGRTGRLESAAHPVPLGLAVHAAGRLRAGLQPAFRDRPPAVRARPVAAVLDPGQRVHDLRTLGHGRGQHGLGPVTFGQAGPGVRSRPGGSPRGRPGCSPRRTAIDTVQARRAHLPAACVR